MRRSILVLSLLMGCGTQPESLDIRIPNVLAQNTTNCMCSGTVGVLTARLHIAGGFVCDLSVDNAGAASGQCNDVTTGTVRPLAVEYRVDLGTSFATVAYALGSVDLSPEALDGVEGVPTVNVTLDAQGLLCTDAGVDAFMPPGGDCRQRDASIPGQWLWCQRGEVFPDTLDCDSNGMSNLDEACGSGLSCP